MFLFARITMLVLALMLSACASDTSERIRSEDVNSNEVWEHDSCDAIVEPGEDWRAIARRTKVPISILKRFNNLSKPLIVDQKILVPAREFYQVKNGDSALSIAVKYGMTFSEFIHLNDLAAPYKVKQSQQLKIIIVIKARPVVYKQVKVRAAAKATKISLAWPLQGKVIASFGANENGSLNDGIKISSTLHNQVKAVASGIVVYVGNEIASYGNLVMIAHADEWISSYGNLGQVDVQKGDNITAGQVIASLESNILYFGLRKANMAVNPLKYLNKNQGKMNAKSK